VPATGLHVFVRYIGKDQSLKVGDFCCKPLMGDCQSPVGRSFRQDYALCLQYFMCNMYQANNSVNK